jgi:hypothetical protein
MATKTYLFAITHWLLTAATLVMLLGTALMVLAEGGLFVALFASDHLGIPAALGGITRGTILAVAMPIVGALAATALLFALIFHVTAKIVETAIRSDPFVGENATRLNQIGCLLLGMEILGWVMAWVMDPLLQKLPKDVHTGLNFDFSPVGLLGILLVFVLAQVFRRGSEMRAELEGTV